MAALSSRNLVLSLALACSGVTASCVVSEGPGPVYADGYEPAFYDGYVVYYDRVGRPYHYVNGSVVWVAPSAPAYPALVGHYHTYRQAYPGWYSHYGYRYRDYHRHR
jgi:hypothetical protein